ncbi:MAG: hypothetical protein GY784_07720 [Gammaproteobacteria bacterium]|nr:hypothetical protein [Gammaproteobacteria bacterium]
MSEINTILLGDFIDECSEHLDEMESLLLRLGGDLSNVSLLDDIFRMIHNIKGASQITGLDKISHLSHRLEDLLDLLRRGQIEVTVDIISLLIAGRDRIVELVSELALSSQELSSVEELIDSVDRLIVADKPSNSEDTQDSVAANQADLPVESFDEVDDQELFNIYLDQLREQFTLLSTVSDQFKETDVDVEQLGLCQEAVMKLNSSAAYMGYGDIVDLLDQWLEDLNAASSSVVSGELTTLDFMDENLGLLMIRFPQLVGGSEVDPDVESEGADDSIVGKDDDVTAAVLGMFDEEDGGDPLPGQDTDVGDSIIDISMLIDFVHEARDNLEEMGQLLERLGTDADTPIVLDEIFRTMHNIKGAAQLTRLDRTSILTQRFESFLDLLRQQELDTGEISIALLKAGHERIEMLVSELEQFQDELSPIDDLLERLAPIMSGGSSAPGIGLLPIDEEHDEDLYNIFIAHLREQLVLIRSCFNQLEDSTDQTLQLQDCIGCISAMQSSASYMGYDQLSSYYQGWNDEFERAIQLVTYGEHVSFDFINAYIDELIRVFPQASIEADLEQTIAHEPVFSEAVDEAVDKPERDSELFDRMSSALELSLHQTSTSEQETLNEVYDELVSAQQGAQPADVAQSNAAPESSSGQSVKNTGDRNRITQRGKDGSGAARPNSNEISEKKVRKSIRVDAEKIDTLMNQVGELVVDRSYFFQLFNEMRELQRQLKEMAGIGQKEVKLIRAFTYRLGEAISGLGRTSSELQEGVMKMRMLPVSHLFNRYPRLVHDLTGKLSKKVNLILRGEETELDRMIVEELSDPLIHIIRNAVDHGIESPAERQRAGKPEDGKLILEAFQESNHIVIQVTDDGCGLNPDKIKQKAVKNGMFSLDEVEHLNKQEVFNLILMPGFSTAEQITGTSGRGVGMDVVKKNIEKLNGMLDIDSKIGKGTQMRLKIPLTLAIIHALMVRVGEDMFTIPLANVDETVRIGRDDTSLVEGVEVIYLRGVALPVFRLSKLFKGSSEVVLDKSFVVIVNTDGQRIGFVVDELLGQEEVVIKPLEDYVQERSGFSGATVVGDGRISLILDVYELVKVTTRQQNQRQKQQANILRQNNLRRAKNAAS